MSYKLKLLSDLNVPYDKNFYNLSMEHYKQLCETKGSCFVIETLRNLLIEYRDDKKCSFKCRLLINSLNVLTEAKKKSTDECECGYLKLEESESCPVCGALFYTGKTCFYKNTDGSCSMDGEDCKWNNRSECKKEA